MVLPGVGAYTASKSALNMLSPVIRRSLHPTAHRCLRCLSLGHCHRVLRQVRRWRHAWGFGGLVPHSPQYVTKAIVRRSAPVRPTSLSPMDPNASRKWRSPTRRHESGDPSAHVRGTSATTSPLEISAFHRHHGQRRHTTAHVYGVSPRRCLTEKRQLASHRKPFAMRFSEWCDGQVGSEPASPSRTITAVGWGTHGGG